MDGHRRLEGGAGQVPTEACGKKLAECDPSDDDDGHRGGRPCGVSDDAAETDTEDGDEADCHSTEDDRPQHAGVAEGHLEVLAGEDPLADLEGDEIGDSATGKANAATIAALPASTSRRAGMAVKVERIMPEAYSAVTDRRASEPSSTAAIMMPNSEQLVASNVRRCWSVMVAHWLASEITRTAPTPMEKTKAKAAVRQVEGRVRSFVHSPLRVLLIGASCAPVERGEAG